jgi:hypothetical protein
MTKLTIVLLISVQSMNEIETLKKIWASILQNETKGEEVTSLMSMEFSVSCGDSPGADGGKDEGDASVSTCHGVDLNGDGVMIIW